MTLVYFVNMLVLGLMQFPQACGGGSREWGVDVRNFQCASYIVRSVYFVELPVKQPKGIEFEYVENTEYLNPKTPSPF